MDLKLAVHGRQPADDVLVSFEGGATVADVAGALRARRPGEEPDGPVTLGVQVGAEWRPVPPDTPMSAAGVVSGMSVTLLRRDSAARVSRDPGAVAVLTVLQGPDAGTEHLLPPGETVVGRSSRADLRLRDPLVSKRHAAVVVGDEIEVVDLNSSNGVEVDGVPAARAVVGPLTVVTLGDTEVRVVRRTASGSPGSAASVPFIRSPVLEPAYHGVREELPAPPERANRLAVPWLSLLVPLVLGAVLWFVSRQLLTVLFLALSPLFLVAGVLESWLSARRSFRAASEAYRGMLAATRERAAAEQEAERAARLREHPAARDALRAALDRSPLLWVRRPAHPRFLELRLGLTGRPSRSAYPLVPGAGGDPQLRAEVARTLAGFAEVSGVPLAAALRDGPGLGVCGDGRHDVVRGLLVQLLALHAPGEVRVIAVAPAAAAAEWAWLRWVPHTVAGAGGPTVLGADSSSCEKILTELDQRGEAVDGGPATVVVVDEGAPVERGRLLAAAARTGVHLIWTANRLAELPAACRRFLDLTGPTGRFGDTETGEQITGVAVEPVTAASAESFARRLAPLVEADEHHDGQQELPRVAAYLDQPGVRDLLAADALAERWAESGSLTGTGPRRRAGGLRALVGVTAGSLFGLDLREHGPHALVGGTTGSGKTAFLQSWIIGLALGYSPQRVTFLLVDYKGGTAFKDCEQLPHTVGLVTDLDGHLVDRALTSLRAELRFREALLNEAGYNDLGEMERADHPRTPPNLVIVVDEFATLVKERPAFVDGIIDVAQRGRSLGLHLILATQRPAGVIKDNLRANTNLRVALRLNDDEDSRDVIGSTQASQFPYDLHGRAAVRIGAGRTTVFQALYVAGRTPDTPPPPRIELAPLRFGAVTARPVPEEKDERAVPEGDTDLARLVSAARAASSALGLGAPRKPWLPPLPLVADLDRVGAEGARVRVDRDRVEADRDRVGADRDRVGADRDRVGADRDRVGAEGARVGVDRDRVEAADAPASSAPGSGHGGRPAAGDRLVFGVVDLPDLQRRDTAGYAPDEDGTMVIIGTGGSGKSATLRSLAVSAGRLTAAGGPPWQVYALDLGGGGLASLAGLPHVGEVIGSGDHERVTRLLGMLRRIVDERSATFAAHRSGTIAEYRVRAGKPGEPRFLLLVDNLGAFRTAYEDDPRSRLAEILYSIAQDGRQAGVHVVVTADRPGVAPPALTATAQKQLVLRLAQDHDLALAGLRADAFGRETVPGRGYLAGREVQVAVPGATASLAGQARALRALAGELLASGLPRAPRIEVLPPRVGLGTLPATCGGLPALGAADDTLDAVGFRADEPLLLAGPPQSGRTTVLATLALSLRRAEPGLPMVHFGRRRSPAQSMPFWTASAAGEDDVAESARAWGERAKAGERFAVFVENIPDYLSTAAEHPIQELAAACAYAGNFIVAEGDTAELSSYWPALQPFKATRHGIVLQPDQSDGDNLFRTAFSRVSRAEFPPGRGLYVRAGRYVKVQVALPE